MRKFASLFVLSLLLFVSISTASADANSAQVRIYHTLRDAGNVNVCINGHAAVHDLGYLWFTQYMTVDATDMTVDIVWADSHCSDPALFSADLSLTSGQHYSVHATGTVADPHISVSADDLSQHRTDARVRFAHLSPDTPAVDIWAGQDCSSSNSTPLFSAEYTEWTDYLNVPAGTYDLTACPMGTETVALSLRDVTLGNGSVYTVRAIGWLGDGSLQTLTTLEAGHGVVNDAPAVGTVRVFHASPDAPAVDVCVDGAAAITNLAFGEITDYIELPAANYDVAVIPTGGDCVADEVSGGTLSIPDGVDKTVYASNLLADFDLFSTEDNLTTYGPLWTSVRFAHLIPDAPAVDVYASDSCSGEKLFSHASFQHITDYTYVPSGDYSATVCVAGTDTAVGTIPVTLAGDNAITIAAIGTLADGFSVELITDKAGTNVSPIPPTTDLTPDPSLPTIADIAVNGDGFSTLVAALDAAGLVPTFADSEAGPFTVFAPTNDAFSALPDGTLEALLGDPSGLLTDILTYHVVDGVVTASDVVTLDSFTTLLGEDVTVGFVNGQVILNGTVAIITTDIEASNGIVHVIDAVLIPPAEHTDPNPTPTPTVTPMFMPTIADIAVDAGFDTLVVALDAAGLVPTFADPAAGPFTVFAPTNDAFAALPEGVLEAVLADPSGLLTNILTYHVVDGVVTAADVVTLDSFTTLSGQEVTVEVVNGDVILNGMVKVSATDIEASNGIVHVIDAVLIPSADPEPTPTPTVTPMAMPTIADIAVDAGFDTLVAALDAAGLVPTFADPAAGPFTVFAPGNDAFAALPDGTLEALLADPTGDLTDILTYHVVDGVVTAADVVTLDSFTTLLGEDVTVEVVNGEVILNDMVKVVATDIEASNGIVHVIDAVLLPPVPEPEPEPVRPIRICLDFTGTTIVINVVEAGSSCDEPGIVTLKFDLVTGKLSFERSDDAPATMPQPGRANVRLWNLTSVSTRRSAQVEMVDLIAGDSCSAPALLSSVPFNGVSNVVDVAAGTYDFTICNSATGAVINTMSDMQIEADQSYSLYAMTMDNDGGMTVSVDDLSNAVPLAVDMQSSSIVTTQWQLILVSVVIVLAGYTVRTVRD